MRTRHAVALLALVSTVACGGGAVSDAGDAAATPDTRPTIDVPVTPDAPAPMDAALDTPTPPDAPVMTDAPVTTDTPAMMDAPAMTDGPVRADAPTPTDVRPPSDAPTPTDASAALALTSTAFVMGGRLPEQNTCATAKSGGNVSPPLAWSSTPAGTRSWAIVFQDNSNGLIHWILWDIPASTTALAMAVPSGAMLTAPATVAGARQQSYQGNSRYAGPCPGARDHTYQFTVHAVDIASLGITPSGAWGSWSVMARSLIQTHSLGSASLSGVASTP
jgi:Raf kinase inhibitor-like YbhB/YbcL family protein